MQSNEKRLAKNTIYLYLMQISGYIFPLLTFPYLTRVLGAEKYGVVVFSNAVMQYFTLFIEFGFLLSATNLCSQFRHDRKRLGNITFGVMYAKIFLALASGIVLIVLCVFLPAFKTHFLFFFLSYIGVFLTIFLPDFLFRGIEEMSVLTYRVIFSKLVYTIIIFVFIHKPQDYIFVPLATVGANSIAIVLTWINLLKKKYIVFVKIGLRDIFVYIKEASLFFLSRISISIFSSLNIVLLGTKFSSNELGYFGVANTLCQTVKGFMSPIGDSIYPYMIKNKNFKMIRTLILILEPLIIIACICMYFMAPWIIKLTCGEGYEKSIPVFRIMLVYIALGLPNTLLGYPVLGALGKIEIANASIIYASLFHLIGLCILYFLEYMNFITVAMLSCITEAIILMIRFCYVVFTKKRESYEKNYF